MGLALRLFLLSSNDTLHALAGAVFMRMLRQEANSRIPDFAGQRLRQASVTVELVDRKAARVVHRTFCILDIDADGVLNVERLNRQQFARIEDYLAPGSHIPTPASPAVVEASNRFIAQGGSWKPDHRLLRRIDAAALGQLTCPRVRVAP
jgi:hypothetical protein